MAHREGQQSLSQWKGVQTPRTWSPLESHSIFGLCEAPLGTMVGILWVYFSHCYVCLPTTCPPALQLPLKYVNFLQMKGLTSNFILEALHYSLIRQVIRMNQWTTLYIKNQIQYLNKFPSLKLNFLFYTRNIASLKETQ